MDGVYGFVSNLASIALTHPIDVVKTNYQLHQFNMLGKPNTMNVIKNILKTRGVTGFYAGITPNLTTYPIFWSVYFAASQTFNNNRVVLFNNVYADKFFTTYLASMIGSTLTNPLFVIKTRM